MALMLGPILKSSVRPTKPADEDSEGDLTILELTEKIQQRGISELPSSLLVPQDRRPKRRHDQFGEVPVIDLSASTSDRARLSQQIGDAARTWGVFQVVNHGVPPTILQQMEAYGKNFFARPVQRKMKVVKGVHHRAYYTGNNAEEKWHSLHWAESYVQLWNKWNDMDHMIDEQIDLLYPGGNESYKYVSRLLWKEHYFLEGCNNLYIIPEASEVDTFADVTVLEEKLLKLQNLTSPPLPSRVLVSEFMEGIRATTEVILELLAEYLGLDSRFFSKCCFPNGTSVTRWNYYPLCPAPESTLGAHEHTDPNFITLLYQDSVGGLQVKKDDEWFGVRPITEALVINIADSLHIISNGYFKSVLHQVVVNEHAHRLSLVCALYLENEADLSAPDDLVNDEYPRLYRNLFSWEYWNLIFQRRECSSDGTVLNGLNVLKDIRISA